MGKSAKNEIWSYLCFKGGLAWIRGTQTQTILNFLGLINNYQKPTVNNLARLREAIKIYLADTKST